MRSPLLRPFRASTTEAAVWETYKSDPKNQLPLVLAHYARPIEIWIAKSLRRYHTNDTCQFTDDDVRAEVVRAVAGCAERYDPDRGIKFTSYAQSRAMGAVRNYLASIASPKCSLDSRIDETSDGLLGSLAAKAEALPDEDIHVQRACGVLASHSRFKAWLSGEPCKCDVRRYFRIPRRGRTCATLTCDKPAQWRGRCRSCSRKLWERRKSGEGDQTCSFPGCRKSPSRGKYCAAHHQKLHMRGAFLPLGSPVCTRCRTNKAPATVGVCYACRAKAYHRKRWLEPERKRQIRESAQRHKHDPAVKAKAAQRSRNYRLRRKAR